MGDLHPTEGVRLLLIRTSIADDGLSAEYTGSIYTTSACFEYNASLQSDGSAALIANGVAANEDDLQTLFKLAKSTARAANRKRADGVAPWPHRVLRWRGPGRG